MRNLEIPLCAVLVVTLLVQIGCKKDDNPIIPTTGTISGTVRDSSTASPINGATVHTQPATSNVTTNASGQYTISGVTPGQYIVTASKDSFDTKSVTVMVTAGNTAVADISLSPSSPVPPTGLIAYYPFNGNANDESGNGNNGINAGATLTADRFGVPDRAYGFDGSQSYIRIPNSAMLSGVSREISISVWVNIDANATFGAISDYATPHVVSKGATFAALWTDWSIQFVSPDGRMGIEASYPNNSTETYIASRSISKTAWHHLVMTFQSGRMRQYVDAILQRDSTTPLTTLRSSSEPLYLGCRYNSPLRGLYKGTLDDIRIYNRTLTDQEIQSLYHEGGYQGGTTIPMELSSWRYWVSNPDHYKPAGVGVFEKTSEGLKAYGQAGKRDGINFHTIDKYDMMNKTLYANWKINGGGQYCNGGFVIMLDDTLPTNNIYGAGTPGFVGFVFVTTNHSYNGSTLIQDNVWYYTRVVITPTGFTSKTATANYDNSGGSVVQTISQNVSASSLIGKPVLGVGDTYAGSSAYTVIGEVRIENN